MLARQTGLQQKVFNKLDLPFDQQKDFKVFPLIFKTLKIFVYSAWCFEKHDCWPLFL